jgi:hypothetical protein
MRDGGCVNAAFSTTVVGPEVDASVGAFDGTLVDVETGFSVGWSVGAFDGPLVGAVTGGLDRTTGCSVGDLVGLLVETGAMDPLSAGASVSG